MPSDSHDALPVPQEPDFAPDGTDLTLIRWMLSLTPKERLDVLQGHVSSIMKLRGEA